MEALEELTAIKAKLREEADGAGQRLGKKEGELEAYILGEIEKGLKHHKDVMERNERTAGRELEIKLIEAKQKLLAQAEGHPEMSFVESHDALNLSVNAHRIHKSPMPKMDRFDESRDRIDSYIARFENYASTTTWDEVEKANAFSCYLVGVPLDIYHALAPGQQKNFSAIKQELLKHYKISEASYRSRFFNSRCKKDESVTQFVARISEYFDRWMEYHKAAEDAKIMREVIIRHQFSHSASEGLNTFLGEHEVSNLANTTKLAERYHEYHKDALIVEHNDKSKKSSNGGKRNKDKSSFKTNRDLMCLNCKRSGHVTKNCPKKDAFIRCFNCNELGHRINNCPKNSKVASAAENHCGNDGGSQVGLACLMDRVQRLEESLLPQISATQVQIENKLPHNLHVLQSLVGDHEVPCMRDSGCTTAVVARKHVNPTQYIGRSCSLKMIDSSTICVPLVSINVHTPWYTGQIEAMCLENPICDLVLGNLAGVKKSEEPDPNFALHPVELSNSCLVDLQTQLAELKDAVRENAVKTDAIVESFECNFNKCSEMIHNVITRFDEFQASKVPIDSEDNRSQSVSCNPCDFDLIDSEFDMSGENEAIGAVITRAQQLRDQHGPDKLIVADSIGVSVTHEEMVKLQRADSTLSSYFKRLPEPKEKGESKVSFHFKNKLLYRQFQNPHVNFNTTIEQLIVPQKLRKEVMKVAHESILGGHMSVGKTCDKIMSCFFWPGITADVTRFCRSCDICQKTVPKGKVSKGDLQKMPIIDTPFKRVAVDLVGPLFPVSDNGYRYILTLVDYATRYPEAVPMKFITAHDVAEALVNIYSRLGVPTEILSDQGTQFMSEVMKQVNKLLGVNAMRSSPYHPQCNGLVERFNGTLKKMLQRMCSERPKDWDRYINALLFAYREVPQRSTGFSPFELMYGREVRGPMQILKELWTDDCIDDEVKNTYQYVFDLQNRMEKTMEVAQEELLKSQEANKKYFDLKSRNRSFKAGDKVLLLLPTDNSKLLVSWKGPYEVVEKTAKHNYRILVRGKLKVFHVNMLKMYHDREKDMLNSHDSVISAASIFVDIDTVVSPVIEEEDNIHYGLASHVDECVDFNEEDLIEFMPVKAQENYHDVKVGNDLSKKQESEIRSVIYEYRDMFTDVPGTVNCGEHSIELIENSPVKSKPYPIPYSIREALNKEVDEMLRLGVIRESKSPFASPTVMVRKKDGSNRVCIDFRKVNRKCIFDPEPVMKAEDIFAGMGDSKLFVSIDLAKGYWQIPVKKEDIPKTAFVTPDGHYEYLKMPFGMVNSGATLIRCLRTGFNALRPVSYQKEDGKVVTVSSREKVDFYVDDIVVKAKTWEELVAVTREVLRVLKGLGFTIRPSKCVFGSKSIDFLGKGVSDGVLTMQEANVKKILEALPPTSKKEIRSFLGMVGFYQSFVPSYASISSPLTDATRKNCPNKLVLNEEQLRSFQKLKEVILSKPVLRLPKLEQEFVLRTDASNRGLGAVLLQEHEGNLFPVAYASKKLNDAERRYSTLEREGLAIVWAVKKFQMYLYGRPFVLETDHQPLVNMNKTRYANNRVSRWCMFLQSFDIRIRSIKGEDNHFADFLSRLDPEIKPEEEVESGEERNGDVSAHLVDTGDLREGGAPRE